MTKKQPALIGATRISIGRKCRFIYFLLLLSFLESVVCSAENNIRFSHISVEDGLSNVTVLSIIQDYQGFMWFGTNDGLCKYDGYTYTTYRNDPADPTSLTSNEILTIFEDSKNNLWIGTWGAGLCRYIREEDRFVAFTHDEHDANSISHNIVQEIYEDRDGRLWIGTSEGLNLFDQENGKFTRYLHDENDSSSLSHNNIRGICEDGKGNFWIATNGGGLNRFSKETKKFVHYRSNSQDSNSLINNAIRSISKDHDGIIWISTSRGLDWVDPAKEQVVFNHFQYTPVFPESVSEGMVYVTYADIQGRIWIGSDYGLGLYDKEKNSLIHYRHDASDPNSLSQDQVWSIFQDKTGLLWVGTHWAGINIYNPTYNAFNHFTYSKWNPNGLSNESVQAFHEDQDGAIWIGVDHGGVNLFDNDKKSFKHYRHDREDPNSLSNDPVLTIGEDHDGNLWVGTWGGGLNRFDRKSEIFKHYLPDENNPGSLCNENVYAVYEDKRNNLWVGTYESGLHLFNRAENSFTHFHPDANDPTALSSGRVFQVFEDSRGNLWICTIDGLNLFDRDAVTFTVFRNKKGDPRSLVHNAIRTIFEDSRGRLWIGTSGGLSLYDYNTLSFKTYTTKDGLPNNMVSCILEDEQGDLWLGTYKGISKFAPDTETFQNYDKKDGLLSDQVNLRSCLKSRSGELYFGSPHGFVSFNPKDILRNENIPPIVVTDFQIFNKPVAIGPDSPLKKHISVTDEIILTHRDYVFSFAFSALDYIGPEKNRYRYILENFETEWNYKSADDRKATYTNLSPGEYLFKVQGSNNDGVWNMVGATVRIIIVPPWWLTLWFKMVIVIGAVCLFFGVFLLQRKRAEYREKKLEVQVAQRTGELQIARDEADAANQAKSEFLANMSHEIRTPMNAVLGFAEILKGKETDPHKFHYIDTIYTSGKALLGLINDILDLSKVEAGKLELQYTTVCLPKLMADVRTIFQQKVMEKELGFKLEFDERIPKALIMDPVRIRQILVNMIGNAIKFTDEGAILLAANLCESDYDTQSCVDLRITVKDTGIGIPKNQCDKVFEAFEQTKGQKTAKYGGTGLGLAITKRLIEMMKGEVTVESDVGQGTAFHIDLKGVEVAAAEAVEDQDSIIDKSSITFEAAKILICDDIDFNRELIATYLESWEFDLLEASNGQEAIDQMREHKPDIILLDMKMPVMDGYEASRQMKADAAIKDIPIIAVTASALKRDEELISEICDGYVRKPISQEQLTRELMRFLPHTIIESALPEQVDEKERPSEHVAEDLSLLSQEFISEIRKAAELGSLNRINELIESISNDFPSFAADLQKSADNFDFGAILTQLDGLDA